jgi:phospholipid/cholesterol/gamma-HCH transport system substrate-binding protein
VSSGTEEQKQVTSRVARTAAVAAVVGGTALVALLIFGGSASYTVSARFQNAGQLVRGNLVEIGGTKAGSVKGFEVTPDGEVVVELGIDERYAPLRHGTRAIIRAGSLSSVANRYVELFLPGEDEAGSTIQDGGEIGIDKTTTGVELDQFFNIFDKQTRKGLRGFYEGGRRQYEGRGEQANRGLRYLSPSLDASTRLFEELSHDPPVLERFLVNSSRFVTALSERRDDVAELIANLNQTTRAIGSQKRELAELVGLFPDFMRTANTTYVNLRTTLDDLDPLVDATKPVAQKLGPVLDELRPFARDAVPVVRDLSALTRSRGPPPNDLLELNRTYPPLADVAVDTLPRLVDAGAGPVDVGERRGAFPELTESLRDSAPIVAHGRPYTVDFLGWLDDFSHTGNYDALGSFSRAQAYVNAFTPSNGAPVPIDPTDRGEIFKRLAKLAQYKRCPGASEEPAPDGSNVWSEAEQKALDCEESARATGAKK